MSTVETFRDARDAEQHIDESVALLTIREVCAELRIGRTTAWRLVRSGDLLAFKIGGGVRIPASSLRDYLERHAIEPMHGRRPPRSWSEKRHRRSAPPTTMETP